MRFLHDLILFWDGIDKVISATTLLLPMPLPLPLLLPLS
jgi:hypothetical protein